MNKKIDTLIFEDIRCFVFVNSLNNFVDTNFVFLYNAVLNPFLIPVVAATNLPDPAPITIWS